MKCRQQVVSSKQKRFPSVCVIESDLRKVLLAFKSVYNNQYFRHDFQLVTVTRNYMNFYDFTSFSQNIYLEKQQQEQQQQKNNNIKQQHPHNPIPSPKNAK